MIINKKRPPATGFDREPVDNSPSFRGAVDNFSQHSHCAFAYLLCNSHKSREANPGAACWRLAAKVMHISNFA